MPELGGRLCRCELPKAAFLQVWPRRQVGDEGREPRALGNGARAPSPSPAGAVVCRVRVLRAAGCFLPEKASAVYT